MENEPPETEFFLDLTPRPSQLRALAERSLNWRLALGELIDNAFDARANGIHFDFSAKKIVVRDDGVGTPNLQAMLRLGDHAPGPGSKMGRYGVGLKDSVLWIGGDGHVLQIESVHDGVKRRVHVDWRTIIGAKSWADVVVAGTERPAEPSAVSGTTLTILNPARKLPYGADFGKLLEEIGYLYAAALKQGRQITIRIGNKKTAQRIECWQLPRLEPGHVDRHIEINGRRAHVSAGVVAPGETNHRPGLTYSHAYRVIKRNCTAGLNGFSPAHIAGSVEVDDGWTLTTNKDDLSRGEMLYDAVYEVMKPILERAERRSSVLVSRAFDEQISKVLNEALFGKASEDGKPADSGDRKEKRGEGDEKGTRPPKNTGKRRGGKNLQPGEKLRARGVASLKIDWNGKADRSVGEVHLPTVLLNSNNPLLARMRAEQNADGIVSNVMWLLADFDRREEQNGQRKLNFPHSETNDLSIIVGAALAEEHSLDGKPPVAAE